MFNLFLFAGSRSVVAARMFEVDAGELGAIVSGVSLRVFYA